MFDPIRTTEQMEGYREVSAAQVLAGMNAQPEGARPMPFNTGRVHGPELPGPLFTPTGRARLTAQKVAAHLAFLQMRREGYSVAVVENHGAPFAFDTGREHGPEPVRCAHCVPCSDAAWARIDAHAATLPPNPPFSNGWD